MLNCLVRALRKDTGKLIEGYYCKLHFCQDDVGMEPHSIYNEELRNWFEVDPNTVEHCVGVVDNNGKLVFGGDIICVPYTEDTEYGFHTYYEYGIIYFDETYLGWYVQFNDGGLVSLSEYEEDFIVTGNIYNTPLENKISEEIMQGFENELEKIDKEKV